MQKDVMSLPERHRRDQTDANDLGSDRRQPTRGVEIERDAGRRELVEIDAVRDAVHGDAAAEHALGVRGHRRGIRNGRGASAAQKAQQYAADRSRADVIVQMPEHGHAARRRCHGQHVGLDGVAVNEIRANVLETASQGAGVGSHSNRRQRQAPSERQPDACPRVTQPRQRGGKWENGDVDAEIPSGHGQRPFGRYDHVKTPRRLELPNDGQEIHQASFSATEAARRGEIGEPHLLARQRDEPCHPRPHCGVCGQRRPARRFEAISPRAELLEDPAGRLPACAKDVVVQLQEHRRTAAAGRQRRPRPGQHARLVTHYVDLEVRRCHPILRSQGIDGHRGHRRDIPGRPRTAPPRANLVLPDHAELKQPFVVDIMGGLDGIPQPVPRRSWKSRSREALEQR